jgi:hypothetical protein
MGMFDDLAMTAQDIQEAIANGGRRAAKSGTGGNVDNAVRQEVDKAGGDLSLTPEEQAQRDRTVLGDRLTNAARYVGKLDPTSGGLSAMLHLMSTIPTGGANMPFAAAGFGARKLAEARTLANGRQLSQMILSRSPLAQSIPLPPLPQLGLSPLRRLPRRLRGLRTWPAENHQLVATTLTQQSSHRERCVARISLDIPQWR